jgi:outer membrane lipoprotein-sorting protein
MIRAHTLVAIACFIAAPLAHCAESWDLPQLMAGLAQVQSRDSRFTEKKTMALLKAPLESSGVLSYRRPDHVEKHVLQPKDESISVDGDELTWKDGVSGKKRSLRLQDNAVVAALVNSIRGTLAGDLPALQRYFDLKLDGTRASWVLSLTPTEKTMRRSVQAMRIEGSDNQVATVDVQESGGDRSVMVIKND